MHSTVTTTTTNMIRSSSKMAARKFQPSLPVMSRNKSSSFKGMKEACATELAELRRTASRLSGVIRTLSSTGTPKNLKSPIVADAAFEDKPGLSAQVVPSTPVVATKPKPVNTTPRPGDRCEEKKVIYMTNSDIMKIQASRANDIAELKASFAQSYTNFGAGSKTKTKPTPFAGFASVSTSPPAVIDASKSPSSKPMTVWTDAIEFFSKENVNLVNSYSRVTNVVDERPSDIIIEADPGRVRPRYHVSSDKKVHQRHMEAFWCGGFGF
ncbi:hypothetical protein D9758_005193 [Tetrapyrgos nigripes]|uniref:Uncharacterized protein n=1 Tax=Tetrapyrgos nigripes TaxID=182062 RepID=A0A8H5GWN2_9AGAR|nr:hypothetical protein D9758_005193 [Tetrapyrgos nigripes]